MRLVLEVVSEQAEQMGPNRRVIIGPAGARIGRDRHNDWVIPDRYVSSHHATIRFLNKMFFIEARGTNRTAINDPERGLTPDQLQALQNGDRLFIDQYEISVRLVADEREIEPIIETSPARSPERSTLHSRGNPDTAETHEPKSTDPIELLGGTRQRQRESQPTPGPSVSSAHDPLHRALPPSEIKNAEALAHGPAPAPGPGIPWFETHYPRRQSVPPPRAPGPLSRAPEESPQPTQTPDSQPATTTRPIDDSSFGQLLSGAGIDPARLPVDAAAARELGIALRLVVESAMKLLRARGEIRHQFRLPGTRIEARDNNPLKFSADADEAFEKLLGKRSGAYLESTEAFEQAFAELEHHQLAMLNGLRAGFEKTFNHFDPRHLQQKEDDRQLIGMLGSGRARLWNAYVEAYADLAADPDAAFQRLFGEAFAAAYEEQMQRLKKQTPRPVRPRRTREP